MTSLSLQPMGSVAAEASNEVVASARSIAVVAVAKRFASVAAVASIDSEFVVVVLADSRIVA